MEGYKDCPHYMDAERHWEEYQRLVEKAREEIVSGMKGLFPNSESVIQSLSVQITNAAELKAEIDLAKKEALMYPILQVKRSREGNEALTTNPIHEVVRVKRATYNQMLRDLGFRVNPEKVETSIGKNEVTVEESGSNDPAADFVRKTLEGIS